jgi:hypothetical protein
VDLATAKVAVGALTIDYTQQLSADPAFSPAMGDVVDVVGVQPAFGSVLILDSFGGSISVVAAASEAAAARQ